MDAIFGALTTVKDFIGEFIMRAIEAIFNVLFFWLPDDPFIGPINSFNMSSISQGLSWLNWFIDIGLLVGITTVVISALLIWGAFKLGMTCYTALTRLIELLPFE